jgi:hypothetical protein
MFARALTAAGLTSILVVAVFAQPALAYKEISHTGTRGPHSLQDTFGSPGATCAYGIKNQYDEWRLKHLSVKPPLMKAVSGMGTERVAWRFTVQRRHETEGGHGPWEDRYTSPSYSTTTDATHNAAFVRRGVKVIVSGGPTAGGGYTYRAIVDLTWYKANGTTVLGTARERVDWYLAHGGSPGPSFNGCNAFN